MSMNLKEDQRSLKSFKALPMKWRMFYFSTVVLYGTMKNQVMILCVRSQSRLSQQTGCSGTNGDGEH